MNNEQIVSEGIAYQHKVEMLSDQFLIWKMVKTTEGRHKTYVGRLTWEEAQDGVACEPTVQYSVRCDAKRKLLADMSRHDAQYVERLESEIEWLRSVCAKPQIVPTHDEVAR